MSVIKVIIVIVIIIGGTHYLLGSGPGPSADAALLV